jgi:hypothetical protein
MVVGQVVAAPPTGVVGVGVRKYRPVYGLPGIDVKVTSRTVDALIGKFK